MFDFISKMLKRFIYQIKLILCGIECFIEDKIYCKYNKFEPIPRYGDVAVVTGGSRGLGTAIVKNLLKCHMHVVIGCRSVEAGENLIKKLRTCEGISEGKAMVIELDLMSIDSIERFVKQLLEITDKVHVLINNASVFQPPYYETVEGFEAQFGINYVGHFHLTHLLLESINYTGQQSERKARIVNISSMAYKTIHGIDYWTLENAKDQYVSSFSYAQSKMAQLMFSNALDRCMVNDGMKVRSIACHPGLVKTDLFSNHYIKYTTPSFVYKTMDEGAATVLFASLSDELEGVGGVYLSNCKTMPIANKYAADKSQQDKLFNYTMERLNIKKFGRI